MSKPAWILVLGALFAQAPSRAEDVPPKPEPNAEEKKASQEADALYDFLRDATVTKADAKRAANNYEPFRLKSEVERRKLRQDLREQRQDKDAAKYAKGANRFLKGKGLTSGRGLHVNQGSLDKLRADVEALARKNPKDYESLMQDADRRASMLKRYGFGAPEDVQALEPFVFGDLQARLDEKDIAAALKAYGLPQEDALWVLNAVPALGDLLRKSKEDERKKAEAEKRAKK